ncbi:MAG TPA: hypothetical protein VF021_00920 [Longimicrobiales bacterium]
MRTNLPRVPGWCLLVLLLLWALPAHAYAQQRAPTQQQVDSLRVQLRVLRARLDSALIILSRLQGAAAPAVVPADTARPGDELAALRAAAAQETGRDTLKADTAMNTVFVGRERNQSQLNPEISATGDVRAYATSKGVQRDNFVAREFEFGFQSALDPYAHTKIFLSVEGQDVGIEEGYAYWTGLPGHIRLDFGKFRQQLGELNRWHLHALPETEYPLALTRYTGEDGLAQPGVSAYWAAPVSGVLGTHEFTAQLTAGTNETLFNDSRRPTVLAHVNNFWQVTPSTYFQLGATGIYGTDPGADLKSRLGGLDFRVTWRPPQGALYREFTLRGELLALDREIAGIGETRYGGYVGGTYKLGQRWIAGVRYDYVQEPDGSGTTRQIIPSLTMWESEWVYLRGQYQYSRTAGLAANHQFALQAVWAIGPHKHEIY